MAASIQSSTGSPPAADASSRRTIATSRVRNERHEPEPEENAGSRGRPRQRRRCGGDQRIGKRGQVDASTGAGGRYGHLRAAARMCGSSAAAGCGRADRPRCACTRRLSSSASSRASLAVSCARSASGCQRWMTAVAKRPSLRRTPQCSRRISRSESSRPQPQKLASKPSTRSRSARQTARLQERAPRQRPARSLRKGPSGSRSSALNRLTPPRRRRCVHCQALQHLRLQALAQDKGGQRR